MNRSARLQSARHWMRSYTGRDIIRGYCRWFGVDPVCAILELRQLGLRIDDGRLEAAKRTEMQKAAQRKARKLRSDSAHLESDDTDGEFACIAGYTSNGVPYGIRWDEQDAEATNNAGAPPLDGDDDDIPF